MSDTIAHWITGTALWLAAVTCGWVIWGPRIVRWYNARQRDADANEDERRAA